MVAYSFQPRFVQPIRVGLSSVSLSFDCAPKRQTIRATGLRRHAQPGQELQLYCRQRHPSGFLIGRATCSSSSSILIRIGEDADMAFRIDGKRLRDSEAEAFAKSDGFGSLEDMWLFWREQHKKVTNFGGVIVGWAP